MKRSLIPAAVLAALALSVPVVRAQDVAAPAADVIVAHAAGLTWMDAPPALPPGATIAVLQGDPTAEGPFTIRLRMPAGFEIKPHTHPTAENVTVLSGTLHLGMGETMDKTAGTEFETGDFTSIPGGMAHYAWTEGPTEIQIHDMGPFVLTYVNPDDDPRNAAR